MCIRDRYSQLLEAAIEKKQGKEKKRQKGNAELNLQIDAYIPSDYISDERQKIEIYKRIREIQVQEDYELLQEMCIRDRTIPLRPLIQTLEW